jgi:RND family efflux transporter MFP subunit
MEPLPKPGISLVSQVGWTSKLVMPKRIGIRGSWRAWARAWLIASMAATGCACKGTASEPVAPHPVLTVEVVSPTVEMWPDVLVASGEVVPWQEASIGAEVGGVRLDEVLVNVGDAVKKGQLLAHYNEDSLRAVLAQLEAAVLECEANAANAEADAQRADKLGESDAISQQAMVTLRTQAKVAEARLAAAKANRDEQLLRLSYARVVSPDDGVISSRSATVGSVGTIGVELFRLVRQNRLEWHAEIPAESFPKLKPGLAATLKADSGLVVNGVLRQLSPTVDTNTRNGLAYVDLPPGSGLAAGMYLSGELVLPTRRAVAIVESALVLRDGNQYLIQVDAQNRAHEIKVKTARRQHDAIEILGTIDPAAHFVKSGGVFVANGDLVELAAAARGKH